MAVFNSLVSVVVVFLLMAIDIDSQSSTDPLVKRNLLSEGTIASFNPQNAQCCFAENCSDGVADCAVDNNLTTVWTLKNDTTKSNISIRLNASSLVSDILVILSPTSVIPSSIVVTTSGTTITWTTYFNETCQPNDEYLRRTDSRYFSCQRRGQNLTVSAPEGLFSIRNGSNDWLWWETFNQFQLTIEATNADYNKPNTSGSIEIADVQLYGWDEPRTGCNCHPAGVTDVEMPCSNGQCICRSTTTSNSKCIPGTISAVPDYGPVSGGTIFYATGNYLANVTNVTLGDNYDCEISRNNDTQLGIKTSAGKGTDIHSSIPARIYWERPEGVVSCIIANWEFTYRPDPIIDSISPLKSIISGGIPLTVTGGNLDSVAFPFITLVILNNGPNPYYANFTNSGLKPNDTFCHHINSTRLKCITPDTTNYALTSHEEVKLTISMDIDKYNDYTKCEITDSQCGFERTYNPGITPWSEDPMVYNVYDGKKPFQVTGSNFQDSRQEDYSLVAGGVQCEIISMVDNVISFYPPDPSNFTSVDDTKQTILYVGYYSFTVGYIQYYMSWIDNPTNRNGLIIGLVCGVGGVVIIILAIILYRTYYKSKKHPPPGPSPVVHYSSDPLRYTSAPQREPTLVDYLTPEQLTKVEQILVPFSRIIFEEVVGSGNFGKVYRGLFIKSDDETQEVAIKTILIDSIAVDWHEKVSFLQEAMIMKDFSHRNVLSLVAVAIENDLPYVVLPLMENGDLRGFVSKPDKLLSVLDLTSYSLQVAEGMEYLAENKFIHRDLAARNCMINKDFVVKVADFGLARDIFENDYYRTRDNNRPLPVKWMAIECLSGVAKFTESSDVWSFGVLMWELFTRGRKPYADIDNLEIKRYLLRGERLEQPRNTPNFIYKQMMSCWKETPTERPTFKEMVTCLREIMYHAPENNRASVTSIASVDETVDVNQIRLHARRDGPVSYLDLTRDIPSFYFQQTQDGPGSNPKLKKYTPGSNLAQTHDGPGSSPKLKQYTPGSNLAQTHDGTGSSPKLKQYTPGSNLAQTHDGPGSSPKLKQYTPGSNLAQTHDGPGSIPTLKQNVPDSYFKQMQDDVGSNFEQTQDDVGSNFEQTQDDVDSNFEQMQDDVGSNLEQKQYVPDSNFKPAQDGASSNLEPTPGGSRSYLDKLRLSASREQLF